MPKSKNRRKNSKVKKYSGPKYHKVRTIKTPYCKHCNTPTKLASKEELVKARNVDPTFNGTFLFLPQCNCYEQHEDWMAI